jgi:hypothetical protein
MKIAYPITMITVFLCGCGSPSSPQSPEEKQPAGPPANIQPVKKRIPTTKPHEITYKGFKIAPMPGSPWRSPAGQSERRALCAIIDESNLIHSILGMVTLSPPMSKENKERLTLQELQQFMERNFRKTDNERMKDIVYNSWIAERNGQTTIEFKGSGLDTGGKYSSVETPMKLFMRGFATITGDGRILHVAVSERTPDPQAEPDLYHAKLFLDAISWENE